MFRFKDAEEKGDSSTKKKSEQDVFHMPRLLHRYRSMDLTDQLKARFIYYLFLGVLVVLLIGMVYTVTGQLSMDSPDGFNPSVILIEIFMLFFFMICFVLLVRGHFSLASHLLLIVSMITIWLVVFLDGSKPLARMDTLFFLMAIMTLTPLVVRVHALLIPLYFLSNLIFLVIFFILKREELTINNAAVIDFISDFSLSLLFICLASYNVFNISRTSLARMRQDVEKRKQAESELRSSELRFQRLFLYAPTALISVNRKNNQTELNNRAGELLALKATPADYRELAEIMFPDPGYRQAVDEEVRNRISALREAGIPFPAFAGQISDSTGAVKEILIGVDLFEEELIFNLIDVTESKRHEREKEELRSQLEQSQKLDSLGRLAGGVAHDFNNMLGAIIGYAEAVEDYEEEISDPEFKESVEGILKAAESSSKLTRQLLAFARKQTVRPVALDINDSLQGMLKIMTRLIGENIELTWQPGEKLPLIQMDPTQLEQILANLLLNGRDAIEGKGKIIVETRYTQFTDEESSLYSESKPGQYVTLSISDTGCGIPDEKREQIFEPFFTTKELGKGTGLGLATTYGIVKQNKGFITLYSESGMGTTFRIYLPAESTVEDREEKKVEQFTIDPAKFRILVVEDELLLNRQIVTLLTNSGFSVQSALTPSEALRHLARSSQLISLVLTDVVMPEMNGKELADRIKESHPEMKFLFMSGYSDNVIEHQGILDKKVELIEKPFKRADLLNTISRILN